MKLSPVILALSTAAALSPGATAYQEAKAMNTNAAPQFVCLVGALSPTERARQQSLREQLEAAVAEIRELSNGYQFVYTPDPSLLRLAAEWMPLEQRCCPYFDFALEWDAAARRASLRLSGRPGVKEFIAKTFDIRQ